MAFESFDSSSLPPCLLYDGIQCHLDNFRGDNTMTSSNKAEAGDGCLIESQVTHIYPTCSLAQVQYITSLADQVHKKDMHSHTKVCPNVMR